MHRSERLAKKLWFGSDKVHLYLRLDLVPSAKTPPFTLLLTITRSGKEAGSVRTQTVVLRKPGAAPHLVAGASQLEWKLSLAELGLAPGTPFGFQIALLSEGIERERYPERSVIPLEA